MKGYKILGLLLLSLVVTPTFAYLGEGDLKKLKEKKKISRKAAACNPAKAISLLELNNVRARIETGGVLWLDRGRQFPAYEVPKGSGNTVMYAGSLWMGGEDVNGTLKLAAVRFRAAGNDFWPGPLSENTAIIDAEECNKYDRFFSLSRQEVELFLAYQESFASDPENIEINFPGYQVPETILNWPGNGDVSKGQSTFLAPFEDVNNDGIYNPQDGDFPKYSFSSNKRECNQANADKSVYLFGDYTQWWVFNDKGDIHTESGADPIGMEIKAQAFSFSSDDEINNMTFYNYELVNRSTQTLTNTYFGQWADTDLGCSSDDYVGCDVSRGLGFAYNGDNNDDNCSGGYKPYGVSPPAVGIDFFEGPFQDFDDQDNPLDENYAIAAQGKGITYKSMGIGYGDGIVDNERFGMRRFLYHNNGSNDNSDPDKPIHYYNYLRGKWKNNAKFKYGGDAFDAKKVFGPGYPCEFMFPGDTDPLGFGTQGRSLPDWTEVTAGNEPGDRRFLQSAGPFTLLPGATNNITVGVVYGRGSTGNLSSIDVMKQADDKAQKLFDSCFEILTAPEAPELVATELSNKVVFTLNNLPISNNYKEGFDVQDKIGIVTPEGQTPYDDHYRFQGYQVYQLKDGTVGAESLDDPLKAKLVFECDIKDDVKNLINFSLNQELQILEGELKVRANNEGIQHSFVIGKDVFSTGTTDNLINNKKYYFMAIAYAHNNYKQYVQDLQDGQLKPYLRSRKSAGAGSVKVVEVIPHKNNASGIKQNAEYGSELEITRVEGIGNGAKVLKISESDIQKILNGTDVATEGSLSYEAGFGPINIKVIDPLNVAKGDFELILLPDTVQLLDITIDNSAKLSNAKWMLTYTAENGDQETLVSDLAIDVVNEQITPWGISLTVLNKELEYSGPQGKRKMPVLLESKMTFADENKKWLAGVPDVDGAHEFNWIRSGSQLFPTDKLDGNGNDITVAGDYADNYVKFVDGGKSDLVDHEEIYEGVLNRSWSPFVLTSHSPANESVITQEVFDYAALSVGQKRDLEGYKELPGSNKTLHKSSTYDLHSVRIVFTDNKDLWSRCAVIEQQNIEALSTGEARKMFLRNSPSLDKSGNPLTNEATKNDAQPYGMSYFPGYAIDLETGDRLNIAFGEDSNLAGDNGSDMKWNPTTNSTEFGGRHFIYVFRNNRRFLKSSGYLSLDSLRVIGGLLSSVTFDDIKEFGYDNSVPAYDGGEFIFNTLDSLSKIDDATDRNKGLTSVYGSCMWVGAPLLKSGYELLQNDVTLDINVSRPYQQAVTNQSVENDNQLLRGVNRYKFSTSKVATEKEHLETAKTGLDEILVVPNPYYAASAYETSRLDNRVKFTNLPNRCTISIFTVNGTLIRQFKKDNDLTILEWDLTNHKSTPISGGTYLIHIDAGEIGEKILKWYGVMRTTDFENF